MGFNMISCYALLAVYLSSAGTLNVEHLNRLYDQLKQDGIVQYIEGREGRYRLSVSTSPYDLDQCEIRGKVYTGSMLEVK